MPDAPKYQQEEIARMMKDFLRNREYVTKEVMRAMDETVRIQQGLLKFLQRLEDDNQAKEFTIDNLRYMLKISIKSQATVAKNSSQMMAVLLAYVMGDSFASDSAHVMLKMGAGEEAVQELFRSKFGDDFADVFGKK